MRATLWILVALFVACPVFAAASDKWVDEDKDGREETHFFYEGSKIIRAETDMDGDGKIDRWVKYMNGKRFTAESDRDKDGRMDRWDFYTREGHIGRTGRDMNADGKPDKFTSLLNGRQIVMKEDDRNGDGKIDRRRLCEWTVIKRAGAPDVPGHKALWTEQDDNFDGIIDKSIDKKNKLTAKDKIGKPMDGHLTPFADAPGSPVEGSTPQAAASGAAESKRTPDQRRIDALNAKYGFDAADWDKEVDK